MPPFSHLTSMAEVFAAAFPGVRVVHLVRRDRLRQAISWLRAAQDGVWLVSDGEPAQPTAQPKYDGEVIAGMMDLIATGEQAWSDLYVDLGLRPLEVVYEDMLQPGGYESAVRGILRHLDLPDDIDVPQPRGRKQADNLNEEWARRFLAEAG
jgi:LPS sulfotransferase NodH